MTNPTLERAARALIQAKYGDADDSYWEMLSEDAKDLARTMARAVLMAVRDLPNGFISNRRSSFYATEYLEYDFGSVIDAILAKGE